MFFQLFTHVVIKLCSSRILISQKFSDATIKLAIAVSKCCTLDLSVVNERRGERKTAERKTVYIQPLETFWNALSSRIWIVACFPACYTTCVHTLSTSNEWCLLCPLAKGVSKPKFFSLPSFPWTLHLVFFDLSLYLLPHETHVKNAASNNPPSFHFLPKEFTVFKHQCFSKYPSSMWTKKGKSKLSFLFTGSLSRDHFLFI